MCGEVIGERHDACGSGAALATGHRHLCREAAAGQGARAGCNAVFAMCDGRMLGMNNWNHENLKNRTTKRSAVLHWLEIRVEVGIYLKRLFAKRLARAR